MNDGIASKLPQRADKPSLALPHNIPGMSGQRFKPSVTVAVVAHDDHAPPRWLLVEEHTPVGLRLNNPAGHLEQGETPLQAVVREALEETACAFEPEALLGLYLARFQRPATGEDITYLRLAYLGRVGPPEPGRALDEGIVRTLWMTLPEIEVAAAAGRLRSPMVLQCVRDALAGRRLPLDAVQADGSLLQPWQQT
jgi:8-oxo-dGTP pyrophosphatase MutT (NUDIX family)